MVIAAIVAVGLANRGAVSNGAQTVNPDVDADRSARPRRRSTSPPNAGPFDLASGEHAGFSRSFRNLVPALQHEVPIVDALSKPLRRARLRSSAFRAARTAWTRARPRIRPTSTPGFSTSTSPIRLPSIRPEVCQRVSAGRLSDDRDDRHPQESSLHQQRRARAAELQTRPQRRSLISFLETSARRVNVACRVSLLPPRSHSVFRSTLGAVALAARLSRCRSPRPRKPLPTPGRRRAAGRTGRTPAPPPPQPVSSRHAQTQPLATRRSSRSPASSRARANRKQGCRSADAPGQHAGRCASRSTASLTPDRTQLHANAQHAGAHAEHQRRSTAAVRFFRPPDR